MTHGLLVMLLWYFVFLVSLVIHEASHAWTAMKLGDSTAYDEGQASLDPLPHVRREPVGTVVIPFLTYILNGWMMGWASAPVDPRWAYYNPKSWALVSLSGPLANLGAVIVSGLAIRAGLLLHVFSPPTGLSFTRVVAANAGGLPSSLALVLSIAFSLNTVLFVFNLIPFPPLDGSGVILLLFRRQETAVRYMHMARQPFFYFAGIWAAWHVLGWLLPPVYQFFLSVLYFDVRIF